MLSELKGDVEMILLRWHNSGCGAGTLASVRAITAAWPESAQQAQRPLWASAVVPELHD